MPPARGPSAEIAATGHREYLHPMRGVMAPLRVMRPRYSPWGSTLSDHSDSRAEWPE